MSAEADTGDFNLIVLLLTCKFGKNEFGTVFSTISPMFSPQFGVCQISLLSHSPFTLMTFNLKTGFIHRYQKIMM